MEPVLIVGGGPVGLALAVVLARYKVASLVLEERDAPTPRDESRAITWMPRGLDFLDWLGLLPAFSRLSVRRVAHEFWSPRRRLLSLRMDQLAHPHPYSLLLPQHDTEALLAEAATATGYVEIRRGARVEHVTTEGDRAVVRVAGPSGTEELRAPWGVGCDGARSTVRRQLTINQQWRDYGTDSAVADFEMTCDLPHEVSRLVLDPKRPYGFFYFAPGRWRLIYRINQGEDRQSMTTAGAATSLLVERLPEARVGRFLWASAFRLGQGQSTTYGRGRWLLAGDAAHAMGPSAGAGMMVGMLGAWRLGPVLARAVQRVIDASALREQYEREQRAASAAVQSSNELIFRNLALRNPVLAAVRESVLRGIDRVPALAARLTATETLTAQVISLDNRAPPSESFPVG
jgi:2-polyprenyl-6-methoxyphenol hydroxylase-like FAD-dependent oxidoreductase